MGRDLTAIAIELKQIDSALPTLRERDLVGIDETIKAFCDELGIESPV